MSFCEAFFNILALTAASVIAVCIGQWLQHRAAKRQDKMDIFKTFISNRGELENMMTTKPLHETNISLMKAHNLVPIVFHNSKEGLF